MGAAAGKQYQSEKAKHAAAVLSAVQTFEDNHSNEIDKHANNPELFKKRVFLAAAEAKRNGKDIESSLSQLTDADIETLCHYVEDRREEEHKLVNGVSMKIEEIVDESADNIDETTSVLSYGDDEVADNESDNESSGEIVARIQKSLSNDDNESSGEIHEQLEIDTADDVGGKGMIRKGSGFKIFPEKDNTQSDNKSNNAYDLLEIEEKIVYDEPMVVTTSGIAEKYAKIWGDIDELNSATSQHSSYTSLKSPFSPLAAANANNKKINGKDTVSSVKKKVYYKDIGQRIDERNESLMHLQRQKVMSYTQNAQLEREVEALQKQLEKMEQIDRVMEAKFGSPSSTAKGNTAKSSSQFQSPSNFAFKNYSTLNTFNNSSSTLFGSTNGNNNSTMNNSNSNTGVKNNNGNSGYMYGSSKNNSNSNTITSLNSDNSDYNNNNHHQSSSNNNNKYTNNHHNNKIAVIYPIDEETGASSSKNDLLKNSSSKSQLSRVNSKADAKDTSSNNNKYYNDSNNHHNQQDVKSYAQHKLASSSSSDTESALRNAKIHLLGSSNNHNNSKHNIDLMITNGVNDKNSSGNNNNNSNNSDNKPYPMNHQQSDSFMISPGVTTTIQKPKVLLKKKRGVRTGVSSANNNSSGIDSDDNSTSHNFNNSNNNPHLLVNNKQQQSEFNNKYMDESSLDGNNGSKQQRKPQPTVTKNTTGGGNNSNNARIRRLTDDSINQDYKNSNNEIDLKLQGANAISNSSNSNNGANNENITNNIARFKSNNVNNKGGALKKVNRRRHSMDSDQDNNNNNTSLDEHDHLHNNNNNNNNSPSSLLQKLSPSRNSTNTMNNHNDESKLAERIEKMTPERNERGGHNQDINSKLLTDFQNILSSTGYQAQQQNQLEQNNNSINSNNVMAAEDDHVQKLSKIKKKERNRPNNVVNSSSNNNNNDSSDHHNNGGDSNDDLSIDSHTNNNNNRRVPRKPGELVKSDSTRGGGKAVSSSNNNDSPLRQDHNISTDTHDTTTTSTTSTSNNNTTTTSTNNVREKKRRPRVTSTNIPPTINENEQQSMRNLGVGGGANASNNPNIPSTIMNLNNEPVPTTIWASDLDNSWAEVSLLLRKQIKNEQDMLYTVAAAEAGIIFTDQMNTIAKTLSVMRGTLSRWILPYDNNTRIDQQCSTPHSVVENMPEEFRGKLTERQVHYLVAGANGVRKLVRIKIADDNDLEQARNALVTIDKFFKLLYSRAKQHNVAPFQLLKLSGDQ